MHFLTKIKWLNYTTLLLAIKLKKHEKETIQASPKWGKKGVGAVIPLAFYLFYNFLICSLPFLGRTGKKGMKEEGESFFVLLHFLLVLLLASSLWDFLGLSCK